MDKIPIGHTLHHLTEVIDSFHNFSTDLHLQLPARALANELHTKLEDIIEHKVQEAGTQLKDITDIVNKEHTSFDHKVKELNEYVNNIVSFWRQLDYYDIYDRKCHLVDDPDIILRKCKDTKTVGTSTALDQVDTEIDSWIDGLFGKKKQDTTEVDTPSFTDLDLDLDIPDNLPEPTQVTNFLEDLAVPLTVRQRKVEKRKEQNKKKIQQRKQVSEYISFYYL